MKELFLLLVWSFSFCFDTGNARATQKMVLTTLEGDLHACDDRSTIILP